ncbi:flagellar biosynthetic protein FliO [Phenylobacterium sp.]|uniref:flagellar biosynthetic protein FliO n=1 Tax=Phenylobacterium sp. TaxID=1871053 RepID=UPI00286E9856|nr:flagellar biosynthetic protein FliO [Phenylobacterium sp.]
MEPTDFLRGVFALAITLGLIGAAAVALRKWGPEALARYATQKKDRRLRLVETLVIDPARRLVIFECDGREQLLLLGEGRLLGDVTQKDAKR